MKKYIAIIILILLVSCRQYYTPSRTPYQPKSTSEYSCIICGGTGTTDCTSCRGSGLGAMCYNCQGAGRVWSGYGEYGNWYKCYTCNGRGYLKCYSCGGRGQNKCYSCNGRGYIK